MAQTTNERATHSGLVRRHPVLLYVALTFGLSWGGIVATVGLRGLPLTAEEMGARGAFVYVAMLAGPSLAALLTSLVVSGRSGAMAPFSGMRRWRIPGRWYLVALLTAPVLVAVTSIVAGFLTGNPPWSITAADEPLSVLVSSIVVGAIVGLFEEVGWTGFALVHLKVRQDLLLSGIVLGLIWGAWHSLVFFGAESFSGAQPFSLLALRLFGWLPAYRVLMVWLHDRTDSLLAVALMHASLVASQFVLIPAEPADSTLLIWLVVLSTLLWISVGILRTTTGLKAVKPSALSGGSRSETITTA